jgi:hypothetical protein
MLHYSSLSQHERRAAKKLAKELLRTVPAAQEPDGPCSIRGALSTAFMKPENVIGALVYSNGTGKWWGDVVLRKGEKFVQFGTQEETPAQSCDEALGFVKSAIAYVKAVREHPLVQEFREMGCDPERVELLRVGHAKCGQRWAIMDDDQVRTGAETFLDCFKDKFPSGADMIEHARTLILQTAPRFATGPMFLTLEDDQVAERSAFELVHDAAAFLLRCGIMNVDQEPTEADVYLLKSETMSQRPTLH